MQRTPIVAAALLVAAAWFCRPALALPPSPPAETRVAAPATLLLPVRYHRYRRYHRHEIRSEPAADAEPRAIKPGEWSFTAQLEAAALPTAGAASAPGTGAASGGAMKSAYAACVAADNAVPTAFPGCKLDAVHRDGGRVTWSMTCTNRQNAVRSDGVAQYDGDTMSATIVSHLPSGKAGGKTADVAQRITGHYLGPCPAATSAAAAARPPASAPARGAVPGTAAAAAPAAAPTGAAARPGSAPTERATAGTTAGTTPTAATSAVIPPASAPSAGTTSGGGATAAAAATPPASAPTQGAASAAVEPEASTAARTAASESFPGEEHVEHHRGRHHRHGRRYAYRHRRYGGGYYSGGASGFGPNPYSANGY